jgi:Cu/Ag efflux protein CusF
VSTSARLAILLACLALPAHAQEEIRLVETRAIAGAENPTSSHRLRLSLYVFQGGRWSQEEIAAAATASARPLSQCGVALSSADLHVVQAPRRFHVYATPASRELLRRLPVRKPAIFFVDDTRNDPPFDAEAIGRANAANRPELTDTVWVAHGARDLPQALAHELVHLLSDSGAHSDAPENLMRAETSPRNTRLTPAQCEGVRSHGAANGLLTAHAQNEGVLVSVDKAAREIVIRHGRLNELEMPPMTMAFEVADAALLDAARAGDRIWFRAEILNGRFTVTEIRRAGRSAR